MIDIDAVDRRILRVLQTDARISNAELARRCNLSPAACFERVKRLREKKVITGYAAMIDPAQVGRDLLIFVEVLLDRTTGDVTGTGGGSAGGTGGGPTACESSAANSAAAARSASAPSRGA